MNTGIVTTDNDCGMTDAHSALFGLNTTIMEILHSRGYRTPEEIDDFLNPRLAAMHSPFLLNGMYEAVARIRSAIGSGERIGIFADSDLDGITSLAVLYNLFLRMKIKPFLRYLKGDENYGITTPMIDEFRHNGVSLIITVDSGTRDVAEIAYARSRGIDVIITDHHEQDSELPDAIVVNPRTDGSGYPFKGLAGVGVAFKLSHALLMSYLPSYNMPFFIINAGADGFAISRIRNCIVESIESCLTEELIEEAAASIKENDIVLVHDEHLAVMLKDKLSGRQVFPFIEFINRILKTGELSLGGICSAIGINSVVHGEGINVLNRIFLDAQIAASEKITDFIGSVLGLVSIGTIADVVPLVDENRALVKNGIDALARVEHQALSLLVKHDKITPRSIGWTIAPLLNTPGRLGKTDLAVEFFIENDTAALRTIIEEIKNLNESRRSFINEFCSRTIERIESGEMDSSGSMIYIKTDNIPDGYAGLIANRLADSTGKPVIVAAFPGKNGYVKGSGRSRGGIKFFSLIDGLRERFERIGGHENAFGFTAHADDLDGIIQSIEIAIRDNKDRSVPPEIERELEMEIIDIAFIKDLLRLEPFGSGNPEPVFITRRARFEAFVSFGNDHGKYIISKSNPLAAIGWGKGQIMRSYFEDGRPLDVTYRLENNVYNGYISPRMILMDIKQSDE